MAVETLAPEAPPVEEQQVIETFNPFDDKTWSNEPVVPKIETVVETKPEPVVEPIVEKVVEKPIVENAPEVKAIEEPFFKELTPEEKQQFYNETYEVLAQKKELEKIINLDLTKVSDAKKILELSLKYKNSGLDATEIKEEIEEKYAYPKQPKQKVEEDDTEFEERMEEWKEKVGKIDKRAIRDAKSAKPDLDKYNNDLKIPEIPKLSQGVAKKEPSLEEKTAFEKMRSEYLKSIEAGVEQLSDFTFTYKNKDVSIPISYKVEATEKTPLKDRFTDFDSNEFLQSRWLTKEGKFNGNQQAKDVYILENFERIVQKIQNETAAQIELHFRKGQNNIDLKDQTSRGTFQPETKVDVEKVYDTIWTA